MTGLKGLELQVSGCRTPLSTLVALTHLELEYPAVSHVQATSHMSLPTTA